MLLQKRISVVPKDSPAARAASSRLLKRSGSLQGELPPVAPAIIPLPVPLLPPPPGTFGGPPKRRRVGGRGRSLVYVRKG